MKDNKVIYLNDEHQQIVEKHLNILDSIYSYSNNFHDTVISKKNCDNGSVAEFLFLIPNMSFYTAIGFLTALKDGNNDLELREILEKIGENCEDTTGELADILIDETENEKLINDIFGKILNKN